MIRGFSDHAANERTYLAWVRTGIAVIAFGFVIERFNLFLLAIASSASLEGAQKLRFTKLSGPLGRYDGLALVVGGLVLILAATARFIRAGKLLDDPETHAGNSARGELIFSAALVVAVVGFTAFLALG
jgi:putative membrane protein